MAEELMKDHVSMRQPADGHALVDVTSTPFITFALITINVLVFLAMMVSGVPFFEPKAKQVLPWGANFGPLTTSGQWWRLLTACFLHFGITHLGMNMLILFRVGPFTERLFGNVRFLLLYVIAGIGGNLAGLYFHPMIVGAGASGAVFGVYGGLLGFLLVERGVVPLQSAMGIALSAGIFIVYNLLYGLTSPNTDLVAHIAGLLTGFAAGCLLARPLSPAGQSLYPVRTLSVAFVATALGFAAIAELPKIDPSQTEWLHQRTVGKSIVVGKEDRVLYEGTATQADAEAVGQALLKVGLFKEPRIAILLSKGLGGASISIPLKGDETLTPTVDNFTSKLVDGKTVVVHSQEKRPPLPWNDPVFLTSMKRIGPFLASAAGGPPLTLRLVNGNGQLRGTIEINTAAVLIGTRDSVEYSERATPQDAAALGKALQSCGFFKDIGGKVRLAKSPTGTVVSFAVGEGAWDDPKIVALLQRVVRSIAPAIGGPPIKLRLLDIDQQSHKELEIR